MTCFLQHKNGRRFLHIANVGDARAVLSYKGQPKRLTYDHKATDEKEQKRIEEAGGFVLRGRVLGILAVARSFGDHGLKQFVSARPHITITEVLPEHDFVALCCDGIFDVMEDEDVVNFILEHSQNGACACACVCCCRSTERGRVSPHWIARGHSLWPGALVSAVT